MQPQAVLTGYRQTVSTATMDVPATTTTSAYFGPYTGHPRCESIDIIALPTAGPSSVFIAYWIPSPPPAAWAFPIAVPLWEPQWTPASPKLGTHKTTITPKLFSPHLNPWLRVAIFNGAAIPLPFSIFVTLYTNDRAEQPRDRYAMARGSSNR